MFGFGGGDEPSANAPAPGGGSAAALPSGVEGGEAPPASAGSKVGSMKAGDYLIHIHV
jgi:hypothetical protein